MKQKKILRTLPCPGFAIALTTANNAISGTGEGYYGWDSPSHRGKAFEWPQGWMMGWVSATKRKSKQKPRPTTLASPSSSRAAASAVEKCLYHIGRASTNTPIMYCICNTAFLIHIHSLCFLCCCLCLCQSANQPASHGLKPASIKINRLTLRETSVRLVVSFSVCI